MSELDGVPEGTPTEWLKPDGTIIPESAPENVRNLVAAKKWDNVSQLAEGYGELEKFTGLSEADRAKRILLVPKDDNPEAWDKVWNTIGRPAKPEEYKFDNKSGYEIPDDLLNLYKQDAYKRGQTQSQFEGNLGFLVQAASEGDRIAAEAQAAADKAAAEATSKALKDMEENGRADISRKLGIHDIIVKNNLAGIPEIGEMLGRIASKTGEDVIDKDPPNPTNKSATAERDELLKSEAYTTKFHKDHKKAVMRQFELSQIIAREKAISKISESQAK